MKRPARFVTGVMSVGAVLTASALAHTAFMKPSQFHLIDTDTVTLTAAFTSLYMLPDVAVRSPHYHVIRPDGSHDEIDRIENLSQVTVLEEKLPQEGTYKITTGSRLGRKGDYIQIGDEYLTRLDDNDQPRDLPEGGTFVTSQTVTVSEVYVSKGPLTDHKILAGDELLRIAPLNHPNMLTTGDEVTFAISFEGTPLSNMPMTFFRDGGHYDADGGERVINSDAEGSVTTRFDAPGIYVGMIRMQAPAPDGAETDIRSYTTSLTFEIRPAG